MRSDWVHRTNSNALVDVPVFGIQSAWLGMMLPENTAYMQRREASWGNLETWEQQLRNGKAPSWSSPHDGVEVKKKKKSRGRARQDCAQDLPAHAHKLFSQWPDRTEASQVTPVIFWSSNLHVGETGAAAREYRPGERVSRPLALFLFTYSYLQGNMFIVGAGFKHPGTRCFHGIKCKVYYIKLQCQKSH